MTFKKIPEIKTKKKSKKNSSLGNLLEEAWSHFNLALGLSF